MLTYFNIYKNILGCKVDIAAGDGLTPLHVAVIKNYVDIVRMLLVAGSNVNYKTHEKMTPLHFAATRGLFDLVRCEYCWQVKLNIKKQYEIDGTLVIMPTPSYK